MSEVLRHFDEIAPWQPVLRGGGWVKGGDDWWMGPGDVVFRLVEDGATSVLVDSSQEDDQGRACSQAVAELYYDDDVTVAADAILSFAGDAGPR